MNSTILALRITPGWFARTLLLLSVLSALFLVGTGVTAALYRSYDALSPEGQAAALLLSQLNLGTENTVATWFASALLLGVSLLAVACSVAGQRVYPTQGRKLVRLGWLALAALFAGLSFDEQAAVHERFGVVGGWNLLGPGGQGWVVALAVPMAVVALAVAAFSWALVRIHLRTALLFLLGLALYASVPLQEKLEVQLFVQTASGPLDRPILAGIVEEGAELFASLSFVAGTLLYLMRPSDTPAPRAEADAWQPITFGPMSGAAQGALAVLALLLVAGAVGSAWISPLRREYSQESLMVAAQVERAIAQQNVSQAATFFAPDVVLRVLPEETPGTSLFRGREQVQQWLEEAAAKSFQLSQRQQIPDGTTVTWRGEARQRDWQARGIRALPAEWQIDAQDGLVQALTLNFAPSSSEVLTYPETWFPSALALLGAAICALRAGGLQGPGSSRLRRIGLFAVVVSAYYGANLPAYESWGEWELARQLVRAGMIITAVSLAIRFIQYVGARGLPTAGVTAWAGLLSIALLLPPPASAATTFFAFAALSVALALHGVRRPQLFLAPQQPSTLPRSLPDPI